jgi:segregation and condensation protein A
MANAEYQVRLDAFEGPLDLLLHLIRRAEVEITDIPIARIADQYLAHLEHIDSIDIDMAGDFLVMAATLMEIKSRVLAPRRPDDEEGEGGESAATGGDEPFDPRAELVQQLLEYQRYREAADLLEQRREDWGRRYEAAAAGVDDEAAAAALPDPAEAPIEDLELYDLVEAFSRIMAAVDFSRIGAHQVHMETDDTPLEVHAADVVDLLEREGDGDRSLPFRQVFEGRPRVQMIGLFLAVLELTRQRRIEVAQSDADGEIVIRLRNADESAAAEESAAT